MRNFGSRGVERTVAEWIEQFGTSLRLPRGLAARVRAEEADDARQQVWIDVIEAKGLKGRVSFGYLHVALQREIRRRLRRTTAETLLSAALCYSLEGVMREDLELGRERSERPAAILALFADPRHAAAVSLTLEGNSSEEVAASLSKGGTTVTGSAVRQWFRRSINPRLEGLRAEAA